MTEEPQQRTREQILKDLIKTDGDRARLRTAAPDHIERVINAADWAKETYGVETYCEVSTCVIFG